MVILKITDMGRKITDTCECQKLRDNK